MKRLLAGLRRFREVAFPRRRELFQRLEQGQSPHTLFVTCSDSRIDPSLLTQCNPGELFVIRNAGNIVPAYGESLGGAAATLEYAVKLLGVQDLVICGHSHCGGVTALLEPETLAGMPELAGWLRHAKQARLRVAERGLTGAALLNAAIEENVNLQLEHVLSYPFVRARVQTGQLRLHGWIYCFERGQVLARDPGQPGFKPLLPAA